MLTLLPDSQLAEIARRADLGKLAILLSRTADGSREYFLGKIRDEDAAELRELMSYPPDTAGQLMDTRVATYKQDQTVEEVSQSLRTRLRKTSIVQLKIIDDEGRLQSIVGLREFALAQPNETMGNLAQPVIATVGPMDPREEVVEKLQLYSLEELPVVNADGVLLGIIRPERADWGAGAKKPA